MQRARKWKKHLQFHFGLTLAGHKWNPPPFSTSEAGSGPTTWKSSSKSHIAPPPAAPATKVASRARSAPAARSRRHPRRPLTQRPRRQGLVGTADGLLARNPRRQGSLGVADGLLARIARRQGSVGVADGLLAGAGDPPHATDHPPEPGFLSGGGTHRAPGTTAKARAAATTTPARQQQPAGAIPDHPHKESPGRITCSRGLRTN